MIVCEWCGGEIENPGARGAVVDFRGTALHQPCAVEARIDYLERIVEEQGKKIKELFFMTGV